MWLRVRQIALVAERLPALEQALTAVFGISSCYRDPAVAEFGLQNVLFPLGNQFLEIVAPVVTGTAAGRYLERRGGDGGYMVITECDDHRRRRERVEALGVRIAHAFEIDNFLNMQLHPRDTGGSFFEIDQQLGDSAGAVDGPWAPAGSHWRDFVNTTRVTRIAAVELQVDDPHAVAARWAAIAELPWHPSDNQAELKLHNATLRFVPCTDGRPPGLGGLDIQCADRNAVLDAARAQGITVHNADFILGGMRWRLLDEE